MEIIPFIITMSSCSVYDFTSNKPFLNRIKKQNKDPTTQFIELKIFNIFIIVNPTTSTSYTITSTLFNLLLF